MHPVINIRSTCDSKWHEIFDLAGWGDEIGISKDVIGIWGEVIWCGKNTRLGKGWGEYHSGLVIPPLWPREINSSAEPRTIILIDLITSL